MAAYHCVSESVTCGLSRKWDRRCTLYSAMHMGYSFTAMLNKLTTELSYLVFKYRFQLNGCLADMLTSQLAQAEQVI